MLSNRKQLADPDGIEAAEEDRKSSGNVFPDRVCHVACRSDTDDLNPRPDDRPERYPRQAARPRGLRWRRASN
jgi:hypothetical protein